MCGHNNLEYFAALALYYNVCIIILRIILIYYYIGAYTVCIERTKLLYHNIVCYIAASLQCIPAICYRCHSFEIVQQFINVAYILMVIEFDLTMCAFKQCIMYVLRVINNRIVQLRAMTAEELQQCAYYFFSTSVASRLIIIIIPHRRSVVDLLKRVEVVNRKLMAVQTRA